MLVLILLIILLLAAVPAWPYRRGWGYYPSGGSGADFGDFHYSVVIGLLSLLRNSRRLALIQYSGCSADGCHST